MPGRFWGGCVRGLKRIFEEILRRHVMAEIEAMKAANAMAADLGHTIPYGPESFRDVIGECGLGFNAVVGMFIR